MAKAGHVVSNEASQWYIGFTLQIKLLQTHQTLLIGMKKKLNLPNKVSSLGFQQTLKVFRKKEPAGDRA